MALVSRKLRSKTGPKLTRAERGEEVRQRLFNAATKIVGMKGYAYASVSAITGIAGVAQGTFYNYFESRQELLDQLLPRLGGKMLEFIQSRNVSSAPPEEREMIRFRAFFDFLREVPEFLRILNEAELFAPLGFGQHLDNITAGYVRLLKRGREIGEIADFSDEELEVIVHILMGARSYLSWRYAYTEGGVSPAPDQVYSAYDKLLRSGLFSGGARKA